MSKNWYPVIDYEKCIECGACVDMCAHGVYNKEKAPRPVVVYPEGCIEGCRGCESNCPSGAIEYFGSDAANVAGSCNCGCGCEGDTDKKDYGCGCGCCGETDTEEKDCGCGGNCDCG